MARTSRTPAHETAPAAQWLASRLRPPDDAVVASWVPSGFEAYARILHPVEERGNDAPVRWRDVARWAGVAIDARTSWPDVALPQFTPDAEIPWSGQGPREGSLSRADTLALVRVQARQPTNPCFFGVWEGYGGDLAVRGPDASALPQRVRDFPILELPWRRYELFEGPLSGATCFVEPRFQSPNIWWPTDDSWCVASEIDLPWTYVGGSRQLIDDILANDQLEVMETSPEDSLHTRLPAWLKERVHVAVDDVVIAGSTIFELAGGTVVVTLERRSRKKSYLVTRAERRGGWGETRRSIDTRRPDELRRDVELYVMGAVMSLATL